LDYVLCAYLLPKISELFGFAMVRSWIS
jgi:hypothetical protein